ncbi:phosphopantetheine-binding protein [Paenibacillus rhizoplanae]
MPLFDIGGNSLLTIRISDTLRASTGIELSVTDLFRYPTVRELAAYMAAKQSEDSPKNDTDHVAAASQVEQPPKEDASVTTSDIAVIGLAGRFPGAADPTSFFGAICGRGRRAFRSFPMKNCVLPELPRRCCVTPGM